MYHSMNIQPPSPPSLQTKCKICRSRTNAFATNEVKGKTMNVISGEGISDQNNNLGQPRYVHIGDNGGLPFVKNTLPKARAVCSSDVSAATLLQYDTHSPDLDAYLRMRNNQAQIEQMRENCLTTELLGSSTIAEGTKVTPMNTLLAGSLPKGTSFARESRVRDGSLLAAMTQPLNGHSVDVPSYMPVENHQLSKVSNANDLLPFQGTHLPPLASENGETAGNSSRGGSLLEASNLTETGRTHISEILAAKKVPYNVCSARCPSYVLTHNDQPQSPLNRKPVVKIQGTLIPPVGGGSGETAKNILDGDALSEGMSLAKESRVHLAKTTASKQVAYDRYAAQIPSHISEGNLLDFRNQNDLVTSQGTHVPARANRSGRPSRNSSDGYSWSDPSFSPVWNPQTCTLAMAEGTKGNPINILRGDAVPEDLSLVKEGRVDSETLTANTVVYNRLPALIPLKTPKENDQPLDLSMKNDLPPSRGTYIPRRTNEKGGPLMSNSWGGSLSEASNLTETGRTHISEILAAKQVPYNVCSGSCHSCLLTHNDQPQSPLNRKPVVKIQGTFIPPVGGGSEDTIKNILDGDAFSEGTRLAKESRVHLAKTTAYTQVAYNGYAEQNPSYISEGNLLDFRKQNDLVTSQGTYVPARADRRGRPSRNRSDGVYLSEARNSTEMGRVCESNTIVAKQVASNAYSGSGRSITPVWKPQTYTSATSEETEGNPINILHGRALPEGTSLAKEGIVDNGEGLTAKRVAWNALPALLPLNTPKGNHQQLDVSMKNDLLPSRGTYMPSWADERGRPSVNGLGGRSLLEAMNSTELERVRNNDNVVAKQVAYNAYPGSGPSFTPVWNSQTCTLGMAEETEGNRINVSDGDAFTEGTSFAKESEIDNGETLSSKQVANNGYPDDLPTFLPAEYHQEPQQETRESLVLDQICAPTMAGKIEGTSLNISDGGSNSENSSLSKDSSARDGEILGAMKVACTGRSGDLPCQILKGNDQLQRNNKRKKLIPTRMVCTSAIAERKMEAAKSISDGSLSLGDDNLTNGNGDHSTAISVAAQVSSKGLLARTQSMKDLHREQGALPERKGETIPTIDSSLENVQKGRSLAQATVVRSDEVLVANEESVINSQASLEMQDFIEEPESKTLSHEVENVSPEKRHCSETATRNEECLIGESTSEHKNSIPPKSVVETTSLREAVTPPTLQGNEVGSKNEEQSPSEATTESSSSSVCGRGAAGHRRNRPRPRSRAQLLFKEGCYLENANGKRARISVSPDPSLRGGQQAVAGPKPAGPQPWPARAMPSGLALLKAAEAARQEMAEANNCIYCSDSKPQQQKKEVLWRIFRNRLSGSKRPSSPDAEPSTSATPTPALAPQRRRSREPSPEARPSGL